MNKVLKRLLVFIIGVPLVLSFVFFNFYNHLILNVMVTIASGIAAFEFSKMISLSKKIFNKIILILLSAILPLLSYIFILINISLEIIPWFYVFSILFLMGVESFKAKEFSLSLEKISYSALVIFYCGLLPTFITRMTTVENSVHILCLYFIVTFMCDSGAWFFGILFGKNNRGVIAASPNKSIVGFIGGIITSVICGLIFKYFFADIIYCNLIKYIIWIIFVAIASIIGDLIESVFKRSTGVKDSGIIIPGRGGILDCLDSLLLAAPVFYIGVHFLF